MEVETRSSASGAPSPARVRRVLSAAAAALGRRARDVSVYFCGDRRMTGLNRRWRRNVDRAFRISFSKSVLWVVFNGSGGHQEKGP